jgi:hypothetical protein
MFERNSSFGQFLEFQIFFIEKYRFDAHFCFISNMKTNGVRCYLYPKKWISLLWMLQYWNEFHIYVISKQRPTASLDPVNQHWYKGNNTSVNSNFWSVEGTHEYNLLSQFSLSEIQKWSLWTGNKKPSVTMEFNLQKYIWEVFPH